MTNYPVAFGASDATLSASQISGYSRSSTDGPLIQVPTFGTPITIPTAGTQVTSNGQVTLTDTDLCGIFAGGFTNWSATSVSGTLTGPINVVYRGDGSGTTFLLTNHLASVCPSLTFPRWFSFTSFSATTTFASLFTTVPSNFSATTGSQGVQTALDNAKTGSTATLVGYLSPDYTSLTPNALTYDSTLYVASVKNSNNNTAYQPDFTSTSSALASGAVNVPSTAAQASNQSSWVPVIPNPTIGYPIVGYTTIDTVTCFASSTTATDVVNFLSDIYNNAQGTTFVTSNGFVPLPPTLNSAVLNTFVNNSNDFGLNIGNSAQCSGKIGRRVDHFGFQSFVPEVLNLGVTVSDGASAQRDPDRSRGFVYDVSAPTQQDSTITLETFGSNGGPLCYHTTSIVFVGNLSGMDYYTIDFDTQPVSNSYPGCGTYTDTVQASVPTGGGVNIGHSW